MFQAMCRTAYTKAMFSWVLKKNIVLVAEELIGYGLK